MPIDLQRALNSEPTRKQLSWTTRDVLLYHLSLGAGSAADADPELSYTYERDLRVLPTFAMVAGTGPSTEVPARPEEPGGSAASGAGGTASWRLPGVDVDLRSVLHAGQSLTVHRPLPASGTAEMASRVSAIRDKGKAALIHFEQAATDGSGKALWTSTIEIWARGEGGFGGDPEPDARPSAPDRAPDFALDSRTSPGQALLYRLNGDLNPLHADPEFARSAGFDRPVLHGLASYGVVAKALVDGVLDGDPERLTTLSVRFSGVALPGDALRTTGWREDDQLVFETTCPHREDAPVLSRGTARIRP